MSIHVSRSICKNYYAAEFKISIKIYRIAKYIIITNATRVPSEYRKVKKILGRLVRHSIYSIRKLSKYKPSQTAQL